MVLTPLLALLLTRTITLPAGETHLQKPFEPRNVSLRGNPAGSTLVMDASFKGAAAIIVEHGENITLSGFSIKGNRKQLKSDWYLPLKEAAFADFYTDNGILIRKSQGISISSVRLSGI